MCQIKITGAITMNVEDLRCECGSNQITIGASPAQHRGANYMKFCYVATGYVRCKQCGKIFAEFVSK